MKKIQFAPILASLLSFLALIVLSSNAQADGNETLGPPDPGKLPVLASGTGIVAAGTGMNTQPGVIIVSVPPSAVVKQVLLYWEGQTVGKALGDAAIRIDGTTVVTGTLINDPLTFLFRSTNVGDIYSSVFRADITGLNLIGPGANQITLDQMSFTFENNGAGVIVIYEDANADPAQIVLRDGADFAYARFSGERQVTVRQTFNFTETSYDRIATLSMFFSSVGGDRPNRIEIMVGTTMTEIVDELNNHDGEEWDTESQSVLIPAGATTLTVQAFSREANDGRRPSSMLWMAVALAINRQELALDIETLTNGKDADSANDVDTPRIKADQTVTWTYLVKNNGNRSIHQGEIVVIDSVIGPITSIDKGGNSDEFLAPGETWIYTAARQSYSLTSPPAGIPVVSGCEDGRNTYENKATVFVNTVESDSDLSHYCNPKTVEITLDKLTNGEDADLPPGPFYFPGHPITWTYVVNNVGESDLSNVTVSDSDPMITVDCPPSTLPSQSSKICTATGFARLDQHVNVGEACGDGEGEQTCDRDASHYFGVETGIDLEKTINNDDADAPPGPTLRVGQAITWIYTVTNTGNITLTNVFVRDSDLTLTIDCPRSRLFPKESMSCRANSVAIAGQYSNTATVTGTPPVGMLVADTDLGHYFGNGDGTPTGIEVKKFTNGEDADLPPGPTVLAGATVTWDYIVTNTGAITLTDVTVSDNKLGSIDCPLDHLAPNQSMTCTATGVATRGPYSNTGTAIGTPLTGGDPISDTDPSHYFGGLITDLVRITTVPQSAASAVRSERELTITVEIFDGVNWYLAPDPVVNVIRKEGSVGFIRRNCGSVNPCRIAVASDDPGKTELLITAGVLIGDTPAQLSAEATVFWVTGEITVIPSNGVNVVGRDHLFTVSVQQHDGNGWNNAADGVLVHAEPTGVGTLATDSCSVLNGVCSFTLRSSEPGITTVSFSAALNVRNVAIAVKTDGQFGNSPPASKTWVHARINIEPENVTRVVGALETITVTVESHDGESAGEEDWQPNKDAIVQATVENGRFVPDATCVKKPNGRCTLTITSDSATTSAVSAQATVVVRGQPITVQTTAPSLVRWVTATLQLSPVDATQVVSRVHVLTARVMQLAASPPVPSAGVTVVPTITNGVGKIVGGTCETQTTNEQGECTVEIYSTEPGQTTVEAVAALAVHDQPLVVKDSVNSYWVNARIGIAPSGVHLINEPHMFTVTVDALGPKTPVNYSITYSLSPTPTTYTSNCPLGAYNVTQATCQITISSDVLGTFVANAQAHLDFGNGVGVTVATDGTGENSHAATAEYVTVGANIDISPSQRVSLTNAKQVFTITVTASAEGDQSNPAITIFPTIVPEQAHWTHDCNAPRHGLSASCTVTVTHNAVGTFTISATARVDFPFTSLTVSSDGRGANSPAAKAHYVDADIDVNPKRAINEVGADHVFTIDVTAQGAVTPVAAAWHITPTLEPPTTQLVDNTCDQPVVAGQMARCHVAVIDNGPGVIMASASAAVGFGDQVTKTLTATAASKIYADAYVTIEPLDTQNPVTMAHTLTITVEQHDGTQRTKKAGQLVTVTVTGVGGPPHSTCTTDANGQCQVTISSAQAGESMIVAQADIPVTIPGGESITIHRETSAHKTWLDAAILATPDLLVSAVRQRKTVTFTVEGYIGNEKKRIGGVVVNVKPATDAVTIIADHCQSGTNFAQGQCTVEIMSATANQTPLIAEAMVPVEGYLIAATKTVTTQWVDAHISIAPTSDIAAARTTVTYTVFLLQDLGPGPIPMAGQRVTPRIIGGSGEITGTIVGGSCVTGITNGQGSCTVAIIADTHGSTTLDASALVVVEGQPISVKTDGKDGNSGPAHTTWLDASVNIEPLDELRAFDVPQTFTVTVAAKGDGTPVRFAIDPSIMMQEPGDLSSCSAPTPNGRLATCTVTVSRNVTTTVIVTAAAQVTFDSGVVVDVATGRQAQIEPPALVRYVDTGVQVIVTPGGIHLPGATHTFVAEIKAVSKLPVSGLSFDFMPKITPPLNFTPPGCPPVLDQSGIALCIFSIQSELPKTYTATAEAEVFFTGKSILATSRVPAIVHYVDATIDLVPDAVNRVNESHTFTATITRQGNAVPDPENGWVITPTITPGETVNSEHTCNDPRLDDPARGGKTTHCTITIVAPVPGFFTATVGATVNFGDGAIKRLGTAVGGETRPSATKRYVDARLTITAPVDTGAVNALRTITVFVEKNDGEHGWQPVVLEDDVSIFFEILGGPGEFRPQRCIAGASGAGACQVIITSTLPGETQIRASAFVEVEGLSLPTADEATMRWADARIQIRPGAAVSVVKDVLTYTVTLEQNELANWIRLPNHSIQITATKPIVGGTCRDEHTDDDGTCTVAVISTEPGTATITVSADVTLPTQMITTIDSALATWVTATMQLEPTSLMTLTNKTITLLVTLKQHDGEKESAIEGAMVDVELINHLARIVGGTCRDGSTNTAGQCTIEVLSEGAGTELIRTTAILGVLGQRISLNATAAIDWVGAAISLAPPEQRPRIKHSQTITVAATMLGNRQPITWTITPIFEPPPEAVDHDCSNRMRLACTITITDSRPLVITAIAELTVDFGGGVITTTRSNEAKLNYYAQVAFEFETRTQGADADHHNDPDVPRIRPGELLRWEYIVKNVGDIDLTQDKVFVSDKQSLVPPLLDINSDRNPSSPRVLSVGETWVYVVDTTAEDLQALKTKAPDLIVDGCTPVGTNLVFPTYRNVGTVTTLDDGPVMGASSSDVSHYCNAGPLSIKTLTNGADADTPDGADVPMISPGSDVVWTYEVTNLASQPYARDAITVTDGYNNNIESHWRQESDRNGDGILSPGETWVYQAAGTALRLKEAPADVVIVDGCNPGGLGDPRPTHQQTGFVLTSDGQDSDLSHYCNPPEEISFQTIICSPADGPAQQCWPNDNDPRIVDTSTQPGIPRLAPGATILWQYRLTNTSTDPASLIRRSDITVTDDLVDVTPVGNDDVLAPGETWLFTAVGRARNLYQLPHPTWVVDGCVDPLTHAEHPTYQSTGRVTAGGIKSWDRTHYCTPATLEVQAASLLPGESGNKVLASLGTTATVTIRAVDQNGNPYPGLTVDFVIDQLANNGAVRSRLAHPGPFALGDAAQFTYLHSAHQADVSTDELTAWLPIDSDDAPGQFEPKETVTVTWQSLIVVLQVEIQTTDINSPQSPIRVVANVSQRLGYNQQGLPVQDVAVGFQVTGCTDIEPEIKTVTGSGQAIFSYQSNSGCTPPTGAQAFGAETGSVMASSAATAQALAAADVIRVWVDVLRNGQYDLGEPFDIAEATTPVRLQFFRAEASGRSVILRWQTGAEVNVAGFNIYRALHSDGPWVKVNELLIASQGSLAMGAYYEESDTLPDDQPYYYLLEEVDNDNTTATFEPIRLIFDGELHRLFLPVISR